MIRRAFIFFPITLVAVSGFLVAHNIQRQEPAPPTSVAMAIPAPQSVPEPLPNTPSPEQRTEYLPAQLLIEDLEIDASIVSVGMADETTMEVPEDIQIVGWFRYSARPGSDIGTQVLVGHRDGRLDPNGVFRNLGELTPGTSITVRDRAAKDWVYSVDGVQVLNREDFALAAPLIFTGLGPPRLVLLTCGGTYDRSLGGYQSNVVITATLTPQGRLALPWGVWQGYPRLSLQGWAVIYLGLSP
jgi:sortase (surface protein transpeptidase)